MKITKTVALCLLPLSLAAAATSQADPSESIYSAIRNDDRAAVARILAGGVSANNKDSRGTTPLMYAAAVGSADMMRQLIAAGADINAKNEFSVTALMWCTSSPEKVRLLLSKGANAAAVNQYGRTPLLIAAQHSGNLEAVQMLLAKGADAAAKDGQGNTPLLAAAIANDTGIAKLLLEKGAGVNQANAGGFTPLLAAAGHGNSELVKLLLDKGAKVNAVSGPSIAEPVKNGPIAIGNLTPLLLSVNGNSRETVKLLLDAGADINAQDVRGMTPVMLAIGTDRPNEPILKMLLAKKPAMDVRSKAGETALDWAAKYRNPAIQKMIADASPGIELAARQDPKIVPANAKSAQEAVTLSLAAMQKTNASFMRNGGCISCHAQEVTSIAIAAARSKGVAYNQAAAEEAAKDTKAQFAGAADFLLLRMDPPAATEILTFALAAMAAARTPADRVSDAVVTNLAAQQSANGSWEGIGIARAPSSDGAFTTTAMAIRGLDVYMPPARRAETQARIARAAKWLVEKEPLTTEDAVMQLLGAKWAGLDQATLTRLSRRVAALQREDGGWAQTKFLETDGYATGSALWALHESGTMTAADPAYRKGVQFLLETQAADGTWHVRSRAPKFQPYFESGFPYGHDQWLSQMATAWAAVALSHSLPDMRAAK